MRRQITAFTSLLLAALFCALAGCSGESPDTEAGDDAKVYHVKGVIRKIKSPEVVVIDHEEIPGYMGAMAMPFKVKDPKEMDGIAAGDTVEFDYHVEELSLWIEDVRKVEP